MSEGSHASVLLEEAIEGLRVRADGIYIDGTFGRGGHSRRILECLSQHGRLIALDRDAAAITAGEEIEDERLQLVHRSFSHLCEVLHVLGVDQVDGVLLDLGVSSPQIDEAQRGFSFRFDAPLDMRMDTSQGITAAKWLADAGELEITEVVRDYGEERFAKQIAAAIVAQRTQQPLRTTGELARLVAQAVRTREPGQDPATRTFQALRIHINQELAELRLVLPQCVKALKPGGRLAVISFHSLEDRIVKRFLREQSQSPRLPLRLPLRAAEMPLPPLTLIGRTMRASAAEIARNPRARSALMRVAERTTASFQKAV